ncbi:MAG: 30S ribosomal protein S9 [Spirochaetales bacterium]|nr:30S ribosomal protein S9 [Spirochaetales bacterium]
MIENLEVRTGKRKTAVARVYLRNGSGKIIVNGKDLDTYFPGELFKIIVMKPLEVTNNLVNYDIKINVTGGGYSGQAGACQHGIARALAYYDLSNRASLKANGFLTRDSRMVERKKYGRRGARRRFQFSKR